MGYVGEGLLEGGVLSWMGALQLEGGKGMGWELQSHLQAKGGEVKGLLPRGLSSAVEDRSGEVRGCRGVLRFGVSTEGPGRRKSWGSERLDEAGGGPGTGSRWTEGGPGLK